jgi:hypothetical protein
MRIRDGKIRVRDPGWKKVGSGINFPDPRKFKHSRFKRRIKRGGVWRKGESLVEGDTCCLCNRAAVLAMLEVAEEDLLVFDNRYSTGTILVFDNRYGTVRLQYSTGN